MAIIKSNGYNILIGANKFRSISEFVTRKRYSSYFILGDENTLLLCLPILKTIFLNLNHSKIIKIKSGETSKNINNSINIWKELLENKADSNSLLINIGGGVVSDLGGFAASTFKRGIDYINIPTSLLAMVDASVGGKTAINFHNVKNSIGAFAQPKAVFINPIFLSTLPKQHFQNGMAEVFKIALVKDKSFWNLLKNNKTKKTNEQLITKCIALKNKIVLKDPYDNKSRKILNFGHTIGHSLEILLLDSKKEILHGEAIIIGMIIESHISFQKKLISKKEFIEIISVLKSKFKIKKIKEFSFSLMLKLLQNDKKTSKNKLLFSLITKIGCCKYDIEVKENEIKKAIIFYNKI